jgi:hypothetical protein
VPAEWVTGVDERLGEIKDLIRAGKSPNEKLIETGQLIESTGGKIDAWYAYSPRWLKTAAGSIAGIRGLSYTLSGLGLVADAGTLISPQNQGVLGDVDRGAAALNGVLITADIVLDVMPGVGEVAMAVTGAYLAGDYLYQHWTPFHDVANDVGHAVVKSLDNDWHAADSVWHEATSIGSLF